MEFKWYANISLCRVAQVHNINYTQKLKRVSSNHFYLSIPYTYHDKTNPSKNDDIFSLSFLF